MDAGYTVGRNTLSIPGAYWFNLRCSIPELPLLRTSKHSYKACINAIPYFCHCARCTSRGVFLPSERRLVDRTNSRRIYHICRGTWDATPAVAHAKTTRNRGVDIPLRGIVNYRSCSAHDILGHPFLDGRALSLALSGRHPPYMSLRWFHASLAEETQVWRCSRLYFIDECMIKKQTKKATQGRSYSIRACEWRPKKMCLAVREFLLSPFVNPPFIFL